MQLTRDRIEDIKKAFDAALKQSETHGDYGKPGSEEAAIGRGVDLCREYIRLQTGIEID